MDLAVQSFSVQKHSLFAVRLNRSVSNRKRIYFSISQRLRMNFLNKFAFAWQQLFMIIGRNSVILFKAVHRAAGIRNGQFARYWAIGKLSTPRLHSLSAGVY
jgi:hypothetical protein